MRKSFLCLMLLLLLLSSGFALSAAELQMPVFSDDFSTPGLFAERWKPSSSKVVIKAGRVTMPYGGITLRRKIKGNFAISVDLTLGKPTKKLGFCSVIIDGVFFAIRSDGKGWIVYRPPNRKHSLGTTKPIEDFAIGKTCRVFISRRKVGKAFKYVFKVNDQLIAAFVPGMKATDTVSINSNAATPLTIDNFKLYKLSNAVVSPNMVVNSSFEHLQEGMPLYMDLQTATSFNYKNADIEELFKSFNIDRKVKHSGNQSARLTLTAAVPKRSLLTFNTQVQTGVPFVFSVYLKASKNNLPVNLVIWERNHNWHIKQVKLTNKWKRYEFPIEKFAHGTIRCGVQLQANGLVWVDDLQVESGSKATKYQISSLDKDKFSGSQTPLLRRPPVELKQFSRSPVIDGKLEPLWFNEATTVKDFLFKQKPSTDKTIAWLGCDNNNLYIAVRAFVKNIDKIQAPKVSRDNIQIFSSDCIELFLDPGMTRKTYYHFAVNAAGCQAELGAGRILGWNGDWQTAVNINRKKHYIDYEIRIPLAVVAAGNISRRWSFNIGRNNTVLGDGVSLLNTSQWNFHLPKLFPELIWPAGIINKYAIGVNKFKLMQNGKQYSIGGNIINNSGRTFTASVQLLNRNGKKPLTAEKLVLKPGNNPVQLPFAGKVSGKSADVVLNITQNRQPLYTAPLRVTISKPLEIYSRYNYYMNEPNAVIVAALNMPKISSLKGVLNVDGKQRIIKLDSEFTIKVPLATMSNGSHSVTLTIFKGAEKLLQSQTKIVKKSYQAHATQIDHQRRCLIVDGKPFLAIMPATGIQPGFSTERVNNMVNLYRKNGFKCLLFWVKKAALKPAKDFYKAVNAAGIKTITAPVYIWGKKKTATPAEFVRDFSDPSVIAWLAIDEPELYAKSAEIKEFLSDFRKYTPYQPTFMNNTVIGIPGRFADLNTDIIMLDDYVTNREGRSVTDIIKQVDIMKKAAAEGRQPIFYFVAGGNLHNHYREPTAAEQIAQTYGAIVSGCTGISYFLGVANYPADWGAMKQVNKELLSLQDVIFSLEKSSSAMISAAGIRFITRKYAGKLYVIAVNIVNSDREAVITLPAEFSYKSQAAVKFENRNVKINNGRITDKFKALERHVYRIDLK